MRTRRSGKGRRFCRKAQTSQIQSDQDRKDLHHVLKRVTDFTPNTTAISWWIWAKLLKAASDYPEERPPCCPTLLKARLIRDWMSTCPAWQYSPAFPIRSPCQSLWRKSSVRTGQTAPVHHSAQPQIARGVLARRFAIVSFYSGYPDVVVGIPNLLAGFLSDPVIGVCFPGRDGLLAFPVRNRMPRPSVVRALSMPRKPGCWSASSSILCAM